MKNMFQAVILFSAIHIVGGVHASDPSFQMTDLLNETKNVKQTLVFMSERDCEMKMPDGLKQVLKLPKTKNLIIDPMSMFEFPESGVDQKFYPAVADTYAIIEAKNFSQMPYLVASNLYENVGVGVYLPGVKAGVMHVGFKSVEGDLFLQFLNQFPKEMRSKAKVSLVSGYSSILLRDVYNRLIHFGFAVGSVDVTPLFLYCKERKSSGIKYYSYERFGLTEEDAKRLKGLSNAQISSEIEKRAGLYTLMAEYPRVLVMKVATGESCQFFEEGFGPVNSGTIEVVCAVVRHLAQQNPVQHKQIMQTSVRMFADGVIKNSRNVSNRAINSLGPDMEGLERIAELSRTAKK